MDLEFAPDAGGHVRSWKRFAEAAGRHTGPRTDPGTDPAAGGFDLTVYFLQPENAGSPAESPAGPATEDEQEAAPHVRIETVPAVSGTRRRGLVHEAGHTDLARFHPALADRLARHDVLHATSCFALSETAVAVGRRTGAALVGSLHTDVPAFAGFYAPDIVARMLGGSRTARRLLRLAGTGLLGRRLTRRRVDRVFGACSRLLAAAPADRAALARRYPQATVGPLGRGIDLRRFDPILNDRYFMMQQYGIKEETVICCFAGRLDDTKSVLLAAQTVAGLRRRGRDVCFLAAGAGWSRPEIAGLLGDAACLPGPVGQKELARLFAGSDLFLFPSRTETFGNAVLEARASGLPVLVPAGTPASLLVRASGEDGIVVPDQRVATWIESAAPLVEDAGLRRRMGRQARRDVESRARSWDRVFAEDLLPVWLEAASDSGSRAGSHAGSHAAARAG